jgi:hypothetical protein
VVLPLILMMRARPFSVRPTRGVVLAGLFLAGAAGSARAQLLKMGPIDLSLTTNVSLDYTTNANGLPNGEPLAPGEEKEDFYLTYGFNLSGRTRVYPDIDLNLSTSLNREKHFIQEEEAADDIPIIGSANFDLNRRRGHYTFSLNLGHNADSDYNREEVFRPTGTRKGRDITQTSQAGLGVGWTYSKISLNTRYNYTMERHSDLFTEGDRNTQEASVSANYKVLSRVSLRATLDKTKEEILNVENDPSSGIWQDTMFVGADIDLLSRPNLRYTVGMEKEDDLGEEGEWEPLHTVSLSDTRQIAPTLTAGYNASYNFEKQEESDDVSFTYGANLNHRAPFRFTQGLSATREPVSTFGSTSETDNTTISYNLSHPSFFLPRLSMTASVSYTLDKPTGPAAGGDTEEMSYDFGLNRSFSLSRKWTGSLGYVFSRSDRSVDLPGEESELVDEHRFTLTTAFTLF